MDEFILALFQRHDNLKTTTLYQLLTGKRSNSVLTFGFFNDLLPFSGCLPHLSANDYQGALTNLVTEKKLTIQAEFGQLTPHGKAQNVSRRDVFQQLDYYHYGRKGLEMWRLVQFLVQVTAQFSEKKTYQPLENTPFYTETIRQLLQKDRAGFARALYQELTLIFKNLPPVSADFLARTFSGKDQIGSTFFQLIPAEYGGQPWSGLYRDQQLHRFFRQVQKQKAPILTRLLRQLQGANLNQSMLVTRKLFLAGHDKGQLMQLRRLKEGTINDHLIEWSLNDVNFPFDALLPPSVQAELAQLPGYPLAWEYKDWRETVDFLSFRLFQIKVKREGLKA